MTRLLPALAALTALLALPTGASPATGPYFVDASSVGGRCSDSGPGTISQPWCSLWAAATRAPAGSLVEVRAGSYGRFTLPNNHAGATYEGYQAERPTIAGLTAASPHNLTVRKVRFTAGVNLTDAVSPTFTGNEIALTPVPPTNCSSSTQTCDIHTPSALTLSHTASNVIFTNNYVHDGCLAINTRMPGGFFTGAVVSGNTFARMGCVVVNLNYVSGWLVQRNDFADNGRYGNIDPYVHPDAIHIIGGARDLTLDGNYVHSTHGGRGFLFEPAIAGVAQTGVVVQNNVVVGTTTDFGLRVAAGVQGGRITNNTLWLGANVPNSGLDLESRGANYGAATTNLLVENNIANHLEVKPGVTLSALDYNLVGPGGRAGVTTRPHDLTGTPSFTALYSPYWNARPTARSLGVDAANAVLAPPLDADGMLRLGAPDMGAYQAR